MTILTFSALVAAGSVLAGLLGALTGLGGGVVIVPLLTLGFGVDIRYAIGASLVSAAIFALQRDGRYVGITLLVLGVLVYSLAVGHV